MGSLEAMLLEKLIEFSRTNKITSKERGMDAIKNPCNGAIFVLLDDKLETAIDLFQFDGREWNAMSDQKEYMVQSGEITTQLPSGFSDMRIGLPDKSNDNTKKVRIIAKIHRQ